LEPELLSGLIGAANRTKSLASVVGEPSVDAYDRTSNSTLDDLSNVDVNNMQALLDLLRSVENEVKLEQPGSSTTISSTTSNILGGAMNTESRAHDSLQGGGVSGDIPGSIPLPTSAQERLGFEELKRLAELSAKSLTGVDGSSIGAVATSTVEVDSDRMVSLPRLPSPVRIRPAAGTPVPGFDTTSVGMQTAPGAVASSSSLHEDPANAKIEVPQDVIEELLDLYFLYANPILFYIVQEEKFRCGGVIPP
ncbi:hypothetical protein HK405_011957, partial [Cladochytrium tenue]